MTKKNHRIQTADDARRVFNAYVNGLPVNHERMAKVVLLDAEFWKAQGSIERHHDFPGGLAVHTAQVLVGAAWLLVDIPEAKLDDVIVAVLWHDFGKIKTHSDKKYNDELGHISISAMEFYRHSLGIDIDNDFIVHLILSHHGRKEWGSPVEPQCPEAWAIHAADMLSSQFCI